MRNLGQELAQIDPELLTDEKLMKKKEVAPIGAKKTKERKNKKDKYDKNDQPDS
jgi:DNA-binding protein H-NS